MKKNLLIVMMLTALFAACNPKSAPRQNAAGDSIDSLTFIMDSIGISMTFKADYPVADTLLQRSLAQIVAERMFSQEDADAHVSLPAYEGNIRAFLTACARLKWREVESSTYCGFPEAQEEIDANPDNDGMTRAEMRELVVSDSMSLSSCDVTFRLVNYNDSLATWKYDYLIYIYNTAHPSQGTDSITLLRADESLHIIHIN